MVLIDASGRFRMLKDFEIICFVASFRSNFVTAPERYDIDTTSEVRRALWGALRDMDIDSYWMFFWIVSICRIEEVMFARQRDSIWAGVYFAVL